jgi:hypothetical protein
MEKEKNRKIIAKFPTLLEAEAAVTALEAAGISALINNEVVASMMPHASDAFGGFHVSVEEERAGEALQILAGAIPEDSIAPLEPASDSRKAQLLLRRAAYGAIMGCIILPVVANVFSLALLRKAYQTDPETFLGSKFLLFWIVLFNLIGILILPIYLSGIFL